MAGSRRQIDLIYYMNLPPQVLVSKALQRTMNVIFISRVQSAMIAELENECISPFVFPMARVRFPAVA